jgi:AAA domain
VTDRHTPVKSQPPRAARNGSAQSTVPDDLFEGTEFWDFLVVKRTDTRVLADCTFPEPGLTVVSTASDFERTLAGQNVIVVMPSDGPDRAKAADATVRLRGAAARIVEWTVPGLGSDETPDLKSFDKKWAPNGLAKMLALDQPWKTPAPAAEPLQRSDGTIDFNVLSDGDLGLTRASAINVKPVPWLWANRLTLGEMALLAGEPGLGKSQIMLWLASTITKGDPWPDGNGDAPTGSAIILSAEDSPETTIVPRLIAADANLDKILTLKAKVRFREEGKSPVILPMSYKDLSWWNATLDRVPDVRLLIADPVVSYLGRGVNDQRNAEIRDVLEPFIEEIIRPRQICFYAITHLNKALDVKNPINRITGSGAYGALPRHVHFIVRSHLEKDACIYMQAKCNNAAPSLPWMHFRIEKREITWGDATLETSVPLFLDELTGMHHHDLVQIMSGDKGRRGPAPVKINQLAGWLWDRLQGGQLRVTDLVDQAREAGLLASPVDDKPKRSITPLYSARDRIPDLHPGWMVEELTVTVGTKDRKAWRLVENNKNETEPHAVADRIPF